ncbi:MAG: hypothetical protein H0W34_14250 [Pyrinomonadaceae bacterium]|nr:hypothetical protein [Pyrinomonadaceae bacterium]
MACLARRHPGDGLQADAERRTTWRKLKGAARLAQVIDLHFKDGIQEEAQRITA